MPDRIRTTLFNSTLAKTKSARFINTYELRRVAFETRPVPPESEETREYFMKKGKRKNLEPDDVLKVV